MSIRAISRACALAPILREVARKKQVITYRDLANRAGLPLGSHRTLGRPLGIIRECCEISNVPNLAAIVVRADAEIPGSGLVGNGNGSTILHERWMEELQEVFICDWDNITLKTTVHVLDVQMN